MKKKLRKNKWNLFILTINVKRDVTTRPHYSKPVDDDDYLTCFRMGRDLQTIPMMDCDAIVAITSIILAVFSSDAFGDVSLIRPTGTRMFSVNVPDSEATTLRAGSKASSHSATTTGSSFVTGFISLLSFSALLVVITL